MQQRLDRALVVLAALASVGAYGRITRMREAQAVAATDARRPTIATWRALPSEDSLMDAAATTVANNPFRLSNQPPSVRLLAPVSPAVNAPAPSARPTLVARAIVGGPPWRAIVEGIPGEQGGIIVSAGDLYAKLKVNRVTRDTVVIQSPDTTWKLTLRAAP